MAGDPDRTKTDRTDTDRTATDRTDADLAETGRTATDGTDTRSVAAERRPEPLRATATTPPEGPVDRAVARFGTDRSRLVRILTEVQRECRYLSEDTLRRVSELTGIRMADVEGVASFYPQFRLTPAGRYLVRVCIGTACFVKGAEQVLEGFRGELGIEGSADTDAEGLFTVQKVACLGCCMLAPAVQVEDRVYGHVGRDAAASVLADFLSSRGEIAEESLPASGAQPRAEIRMCTCTSCSAAGARRVFAAIEEQVRRRRLAVAVRRSGCSGLSYRAPFVEIHANGEVERYGGVAADDVDRLLARAFPARTIRAGIRLGADALLRRLLTERASAAVERVDLREGADALFWSGQHRIVTEGLERMDPLDLAEYRAHGGFRALSSAREELGPEGTIRLLEAAGLRGRGGAGFATGTKWRLTAEAAGDEKIVICNGDEGDPGAFMDRMILESFPFRVIEGAAIAAIAVGARRVLFYVRSEYPVAIRRLEAALAACRSAGVMDAATPGAAGCSAGAVDIAIPRAACRSPGVADATIPAAGPALDFEVVPGAGAFVCGEETALIAAIEGRRGHPRARPPFPCERGLYGKPTLVNNVETLATVPWIVARGPEEFRKLGTRGSAGTKTFALAGRINRGGLVEVPMGITIREIVEKLGGGIQGNAAPKAVQIGGPSGGCLPAGMADLAIDYEALTQAGAMMGSGGLIVLDERDCMVDIARYFMEFTAAESCGKCTCCRIGTTRMLEILRRLCEGKAKSGDLETLEDLATTVHEGSLCGLGRTAPNPVITALKYFRTEFEAHAGGRCPAGRCKALITYSIDDACIGCTRCAQRCPADAIRGAPYERHEIDPKLCIRCGTCSQVCPESAVKVG